jgi:hypothetical protein
VAIDGWDRVTHSQAQNYPFFYCADKLLAAFFKGLAGGPDTLQAGNSGIIWLRVIDYLIFGSLQGGGDVFSEHVMKYIGTVRI